MPLAPPVRPLRCARWPWKAVQYILARVAEEGVRFGEFILLRRLGAGGMAEVFLARRDGPEGFQKQLVVKRLLPHLAGSERFTDMLLREARYAALIDHPNFVHVSSFGVIDGSYYLAMEYVDGLTVNEILARAGSLSPWVCARITIDLLDALHAIHTARYLDGRELHLVHRDVTPGNVMITGSGTVKVLDLGIAVPINEASPLRAGTRRYMSPEQARGEPLDARSDLYCVGLLLCLMLSGRHPFVDGELDSVFALAPPELAEIVMRLLQDEREDRPDAAREIQVQLEDFAVKGGREGTRAFLSELAAEVIASSASPRPRTDHTASIVRSGFERPLVKPVNDDEEVEWLHSRTHAGTGEFGESLTTNDRVQWSLEAEKTSSSLPEDSLHTRVEMKTVRGEARGLLQEAQATEATMLGPAALERTPTNRSLEVQMLVDVPEDLPFVRTSEADELLNTFDLSEQSAMPTRARLDMSEDALTVESGQERTQMAPPASQGGDGVRSTQTVRGSGTAAADHRARVPSKVAVSSSATQPGRHAVPNGRRTPVEARPTKLVAPVSHAARSSTSRRRRMSTLYGIWATFTAVAGLLGILHGVRFRPMLVDLKEEAAPAVRVDVPGLKKSLRAMALNPTDQEARTRVRNLILLAVKWLPAGRRRTAIERLVSYPADPSAADLREAAALLE